jgi:hypothetical protein
MDKRSIIGNLLVAIALVAHASQQAAGDVLAPLPDTFVMDTVTTSGAGLVAQNAMTGEMLAVQSPILGISWRIVG